MRPNEVSGSSPVPDGIVGGVIRRIPDRQLCVIKDDKPYCEGWPKSATRIRETGSVMLLESRRQRSRARRRDRTAIARRFAKEGPGRQHFREGLS